MSEHNESRRKFIKVTAYAAPVILTLKAAPAFATNGSNEPKHRHGHHKGHHGQHKGWNKGWNKGRDD